MFCLCPGKIQNPCVIPFVSVLTTQIRKGHLIDQTLSQTPAFTGNELVKLEKKKVSDIQNNWILSKHMNLEGCLTLNCLVQLLRELGGRILLPLRKVFVGNPDISLETMSLLAYLDTDILRFSKHPPYIISFDLCSNLVR